MSGLCALYGVGNETMRQKTVVRRSSVLVQGLRTRSSAVCIENEMDSSASNRGPSTWRCGS